MFYPLIRNGYINLQVIGKLIIRVVRGQNYNNGVFLGATEYNNNIAVVYFLDRLIYD